MALGLGLGGRRDTEGETEGRPPADRNRVHDRTRTEAGGLGPHCNPPFPASSIAPNGPPCPAQSSNPFPPCWTAIPTREARGRFSLFAARRSGVTGGLYTRS